MTSDALIEQAHNVFDMEYRRLLPQGCSEAADHDEAVQSAIAAVVALVQADQTRRIVAWLRDRDGAPSDWRWCNRVPVAADIERQFGTQPEERAA